MPNSDSIKSFPITKFDSDAYHELSDKITVEEPMEIRLVFGPEEKRWLRSVSVTMRTPGHDDELAIGFLYTEQIISSMDDIQEITFRGADEEGTPTGNIVRLELQQSIDVDFSKLQRNFLTNSSCGVCGKTSLETLFVSGIEELRPAVSSKISPDLISKLPDLLRERQETFQFTGGIHAAGFVDLSGTLLEVREDVGRHNAVDKLIGNYLKTERFADGESLIMVVSGRTSFELVQKAILVGVPLMVSVGAPSSLAIEMALRYKMGLVGFTSRNRFNIYSDPHNLIG